MIRRLASIGLSTSAVFLAVVAIMLNSPNLFYMGTALFATIGACRLQAWLSVRGLRFERVAPDSVTVGERVTVELSVWSEHKVRRPLVTVWDLLPPRLAFRERTPSFPVAPAFDMAISTHYSFVPLKRGKFRWTGVRVVGTDALGLITMTKEYQTELAELTVLPAPIAVHVELPTAAGWGISEAESGQSRGAGLEPRGVREYATGDSLRHVHWRSSARAGQLLVKEFEAGSHASVAFLIQRTEKTDIGEGANSSLELMCGHVMFLADHFLRQGARVDLPMLEHGSSRSGVAERLVEIAESLSEVQADSNSTVSQDVLRAVANMHSGSALFVLHSVADPDLPRIAAALAGTNVRVVALVYNAAGFLENGKPSRLPSATDGDYLNALEHAGMSPVVMPGFGDSR